MADGAQVQVVREPQAIAAPVMPVASAPVAAPVVPAPAVAPAPVVAAQPKTVEGLYLSGAVYPPYPRPGENVLLTDMQYRTLVGQVQMASMDKGWMNMDMLLSFLPLLIIVAAFALFMRPQRRQTEKLLEHLSAKAAVESVHGDVKVVIEKQNQILQALQVKQSA